MEVQVAVLCDSASNYHGKLCVLGTFDTLYTTQLPAVHPHCSIALRLVFRDEDAGDSKLRLRLIDEDGVNKLPADIGANIHVEMPPDMYFLSKNLVFNLQQIAFDKTGQYSIDILLNDKMMARIPLQVVLRQNNPVA